jgi:hypothetical protein
MTIFKIKYGAALVSLLIIISLLGAGGWFWNNYGQRMEEMEKKDPELFGMILDEARGFNLIEASRLLIDLDQMTPSQVRWNRYQRLKKKIQHDDNFRQEVKAIREGAVERARAKQNKQHAAQISDIGLKHTKNSWIELKPWQKNLVLRETCQQILSGNKKLSANYCDQAIPLGREDRFVTRALENLKLEMDYFDFTRLLNQAGIPAESAISKSGKLLKMTGSLGGA